MVRFESEVTSVVEMYFRVRVIALERFSARGQEERIILAQTASREAALCGNIPGTWDRAQHCWHSPERVELDLVVAGPCQ